MKRFLWCLAVVAFALVAVTVTTMMDQVELVPREPVEPPPFLYVWRVDDHFVFSDISPAWRFNDGAPEVFVYPLLTKEILERL